MISQIAVLGVVLFAGYLFWLAWLTFFRPDRAVGFMALFASSAKSHFVEMGFRLLAGLVFIGAAPRLAFGNAFFVFGVVLIVTSLLLLLLPWQWHRAFAWKVVPGVIKHMQTFGFCSFLLGACLIVSLLMGFFDN